MPSRSLLIKRDETPLRSRVVERLRSAICTQRLPQGTRLVERELCDMLGVSRTSIREALRQLEAEGLVTNIVNRGPSVAILDRDTAAGIYEVRAVLEALAGRLFVERAGPDHKQRLKTALASMLRANEQGDIGRGLRGTGQFYEALFAGARNETIAAILRPLSGRIYLLRARSMSMPGRREESLREMELILQAALGDDPQVAWDICIRHVQNASAYALQSFEQETQHSEGGMVKRQQGRAVVRTHS